MYFEISGEVLAIIYKDGIIDILSPPRVEIPRGGKWHTHLSGSPDGTAIYPLHPLGHGMLLSNCSPNYPVRSTVSFLRHFTGTPEVI
jgi:hypothetical protein